MSGGVDSTLTAPPLRKHKSRVKPWEQMATTMNKEEVETNLKRLRYNNDSKTQRVVHPDLKYALTVNYM